MSIELDSLVNTTNSTNGTEAETKPAENKESKSSEETGTYMTLGELLAHLGAVEENAIQNAERRTMYELLEDEVDEEGEFLKERERAKEDGDFRKELEKFEKENPEDDDEDFFKEIDVDLDDEDHDDATGTLKTGTQNATGT